MNNLSVSEVVSAVQAVIRRHHLPEFVRGYDVRVGEYDGTPGFWVSFEVTPMTDTSREGILTRGRELVALEDMLDREFRDEIDGYLSFYRFPEVDAALAAE